VSSPRSVLVVSLRYTGDVLFSTALARSIRLAHPETAVDYLVFRGTEGMLAGNPDVRHVETVEPGGRKAADLLGRFRKYDVAIGCNASDRTALQLLLSGRRTIGFLEERRGDWWKRWGFTHGTVYDKRRHTLEVLLGQLVPLGIPPVPELSVHYGKEDLARARAASGVGPFVLLHPYTRWSYKQWPARHWSALSLAVEKELGIRAMFTIAPGAEEERMREELVAEGVGEGRFLAEPMPLPVLSALLSLANGYIGTDTVVTHIAAALGVATVAIFGPTPTVRWGPWPAGHPLPSPYATRGGVQRAGNVLVVQKDWECASCDRMGCDHTRESRSRCLDEMGPSEVLSLSRDFLAGRTGGRAARAEGAP